jgi:hypothetical protein
VRERGRRRVWRPERTERREGFSSWCRKFAPVLRMYQYESTIPDTLMIRTRVEGDRDRSLT